MDAETLDAPAFSAEEDAMIISTRIRVGRNLEDKNFGAGYQDKSERSAIEKSVSDVLKKFSGNLAGEYYPLEGMDRAI